MEQDRRRFLKRFAIIALGGAATAVTAKGCSDLINKQLSTPAEVAPTPEPKVLPTPTAWPIEFSSPHPEVVPTPEPQNLQMVYQNFNFSYFSNGLIIGGLLSFLLVAILIKRFFSQSLS